MRTAILAASVLTLAACQSESPAETPPPPPTEDACGASKVAHLMGREATAEIEAEVAATVDAKVRIIRPGDAVTMDYRPDRLNVELDAAGRIKRIRCG